MASLRRRSAPSYPLLGLQAWRDLPSVYVVIELMSFCLYSRPFTTEPHNIFQSLDNFTQWVTFNGKLCFIKWRLIKYYPLASYTNEILIFYWKCNKSIRNNMLYEMVSGFIWNSSRIKSEVHKNVCNIRVCVRNYEKNHQSRQDLEPYIP